jgi:DNA-binding NtrC family response regulator
MTERRPRVLLVDDDPDIIWCVQQMLEEDFEFLATSDWAELNRIIFREGVDLVLMDLNLPTLKGTELVQIIKKQGAKHTKIYYFSAEDESTMARLAVETGADGFFSKSLRGAKLVDMIRGVMK